MQIARSLTLLVLPALLWVSSGMFNSPVKAQTVAQVSVKPASPAPRPAAIPDTLSQDMMMGHIRHLAGKIGPRPVGSSAEWVAGDYIMKSFKDYGHAPKDQVFSVPSGRKSRNIACTIPGANTPNKTVVIGAHYDTVPRSPGANDNASGVAVLLELARTTPSGVLPYNLRLIAFGAEEIASPSPLNARYGSEKYVSSLSKSELASIKAMLCLDMVGAGEGLKITNCGNTSREVVDRLIAIASELGAGPAYLVNRTSDHVSFERRGIPSARIRWYPDANYHRPSDTPDKIDPSALEITGKMVCKWLTTL